MESLAHPLTIAAVLTMLVNDQLFKALWPGWWTGKLSDVAWAVFAPFIIAVLVAVLVPRRFKHQERMVLWIAVAVAGGLYGLFNSWAPFHESVVGILHRLVGWEATLTPDATDSLALLAFPVSWWIWWRPMDASSFRSRAIVVCGLASLATVATSPAQHDIGISCLAKEDQRILAATQGQFYGQPVLAIFESNDGGFTWVRVASAERRDVGIESWSKPCPGMGSSVIALGSSLYRMSPGKSVEKSEDGDLGWARETDLTKTGHEAKRIYYEEELSKRLPREADYITVVPGPLAALAHTPSGNLVLAMGQDGVLIRTGGG